MPSDSLLPDTFTPQQLGILALASKLLTPQYQGGGFGAGLADMAGTMMQAQDAKAKRALLAAQLEDVQQQAALRKQQAERQASLLDAIGRTQTADQQQFGAGRMALSAANTAGAQPGPTQAAASLIPQAMAAQQQGSQPFGGIPRDILQWDVLANEGKNIPQMMWEQAKPQREFVNGVLVDKNRLPAGFSVPQISQNGQASQLIADSSAPGGFRVQAPQGALDTFDQYTRATKRAEADYTPEKVWNPDTGRYEWTPRSDLLGKGGQPQPQQPSFLNPPPKQPAPMRNNNPGALFSRDGLQRFDTPEQGLAAMDQNLKNYFFKGKSTLRDVVSTWAPPTDANGKAINDTDAYVRDVSTRLGISPDAKINLSNPVQRQAVATALILHENGPGGVFTQGSDQAPQRQRFAAEPSMTEKNASDAQGKVNDTWLKTSYEPTVAAGESANNMLANIQTARMMLGNIGKTGWGTDAQVSAARVLSSLGLPASQKLAANADIFNQVASTRLWDVLNAAKGPQTEGDAKRAQATFASLGNQAQANAFILDMMQATAERDRMRASFYRDAMPLAQKEGDLSKVDRKWQELQPSIWSMPIMKRWGQQ